MEYLKENVMEIVVDVGNTICKLGVFENGTLTKTEFFKELKDVEGFLSNHSYQIGILCSVRDEKEAILFCEKNRLIHFNRNSKVPIEVNYSTPHTLGLDRLATVVYAYKIFQKAVLVIDCGTCVTYDFCDDHGAFQGGIISPGLNMRLKSMHHFTNNLPLVSLDNEIPFPGKSTKECLQNGALLGLASEINGLVHEFNRINSNFVTVLTGGDADKIVERLNFDVRIEKDVLLQGLYEIMKFNA